MRKRLKATLVGFAMALGMLGLTTVPAHAAVAPAVVHKTAFKNVKLDENFINNRYTKVTPYHVKSTKKSAYMWNDTHTKKLHNLKNYPTYTWYQTATGTKGHSKYVQVSNYPQTKRGWVWAGYLSKGYNSKGYQINSNRWGKPTYGGGDYHVTSATKNVYLWNWTHTKVVANLKHYTNVNLTRTNSVRMKHDGKETWYAYVSVPAKKGGLLHGYVAWSLITAGKTTNHANTDVVYPNDFTSTSDYLQYIKDSNYQKLTRSIMALFPNTPVDLGMSQIAAFNYGVETPYDGNDDEDNNDAIPTTGYKDIRVFDKVDEYLYDHRNDSNDSKIAGVKKLLDEEGYTQAKRNAMTDYKLGIYNVNNLSLPSFSDQTPDGKFAWYSLAVGKTE